jgi:hypothetical protein
VDRKKPKLTSPWKVGFLVALLLVVTALGVSYFITGTFGVTWHWIKVGGLSPTTWTFHLGAFIEEMVPLLLLTSLLAFGAYVLVAGAVRRYKTYVDSGAEYKQLLKSIKTIDDLETEDVADRLKGHPELREFLMGVKHRVAAMERQHNERDKKPASAPAQVRSEDRPTLASECIHLVDAIDAGRENFPKEIALTIPEIKQIERSLRRFFASMPTAAPATDTSAQALQDLRNSLRSTIDALRQDVVACGSGARDVEAAVVALRSQLDDGAAKPAGNTAAVQKRIDAVADALGTLGEETKRIAIGSALLASGGSEADNIKIAEELKTLATRFNAVARHWSETAPALKELLAGAGSRKAPADTTTAAANVANRVQLWGERAVAMNEHLRSLERVAGISADARPPVRNDVSSSAIDLDTAPADATPALGARNGDEDLVARSNAGMFGGASSEDVSFADIPGFEKEQRFFADPPVNNIEETDDRFVVDNHQEQRWDLSEERAEEEQPARTVATKQTSSDSDGFLTGPRPTVSSQRIERATAPAPRAAAPQVASVVEAKTAATATLDPDADAVDLYALGAIDCVQTM